MLIVVTCCWCKTYILQAIVALQMCDTLLTLYLPKQLILGTTLVLVGPVML